MELEHANTWLRPGAAYYAVDANGAVGEPVFFPVREPVQTRDFKGVPELVIVSGPLSSLQAQTAALRVAAEHDQHALLVAVCTFDPSMDGSVETELQPLCAAYHAVLAVDGVRSEQLIDRLLRTLVTLDGHEQWLACDWNDVRHILGPSGSRLARYGLACRVGSDRAELATCDAIEQIECDGSRLRSARGICISMQTASGTVSGKDIKSVLNQVRAAAADGVTITLSAGRSRSLASSALEVNIFAFGERDPAHLADLNRSDGVERAIDAAAFAWTGEDGALDPLYTHARSLVLRQQRASISLIQRHLRIGYGRASRLLAAMEGDAVSIEDNAGLRKMLMSRGVS